MTKEATVQENTVMKPNISLEQNIKNGKDNTVRELGSYPDLVDECSR